MDNSWCVYILECLDGTYYVGATNNLEKRIAAHNKGTGAKYTRSRRPVLLRRCFEADSRSSALKLEYFIKNKTRKEKALIIEEGIYNV